MNVYVDRVFLYVQNCKDLDKYEQKYKQIYSIIFKLLFYSKICINNIQFYGYLTDVILL